MFIKQLSRSGPLMTLVLAFCILLLPTKGKKTEDIPPESPVSSAAAVQVIELEQEPPIWETDWTLMLVNQWNPLPEDFTVGLAPVENGFRMDYRVAPILEEMLSDARAQGIQMGISSAYRSVKEQEVLYQTRVDTCLEQGYSQEEAQRITSQWCAQPGESEHHTGLGVDFYAASDTGRFEDTPAYDWLQAHSGEYGFILRYPQGKEEQTGILNESWHYRYVGVEHAREIQEKGLCLEEYLASLGRERTNGTVS